MNVLLFILISGTLVSLSYVIGHRLGWWRYKAYNVFVFLLGFSMVYLPFFPYGTDSVIARFVYALVSGGFVLQTHQILTKNLYEKREGSQPDRREG